jgi:hypothetical protein
MREKLPNDGLKNTKGKQVISRRDLLRGVIGAAVMQAACTEEIKLFAGKFDPLDYPRFGEITETRDRELIADNTINSFIDVYLDDKYALGYKASDVVSFVNHGQQLKFKMNIRAMDEFRSYLSEKGLDNEIEIFEWNNEKFNMRYKLDDLQYSYYSNGKGVYTCTGKADMDKDSILKWQKSEDDTSFSIKEVDDADEESFNVINEVFAASNGDYMKLGAEADGMYHLRDGSVFEISDYDSMMFFLDRCKSRRLLYEALTKSGKIDFSRVMNLEQIIEFIRKLPKDPVLFSNVLGKIVEYQKDATVAGPDYYKHPFDTFKSGFADCDDYVVINFFWAYLHNYAPNVVRVYSDDSAHVLMFYVNERNRVVVMDNTGTAILDTGKTIEDYLAYAWPGFSIVEIRGL